MPAASQTQSFLRFPLTALLGSVGNVRMLRVLDSAPQSAPELARQAGLSPPGARLVLDGLMRFQLVTAHGAGRSKLYALNGEHPFASALQSLFQQERQRWDQLLEAIRQVLVRQGSAVRAAWLYGSVARAEDGADSDLDLAFLVSSPRVADQLREDLMPLEDSQHLRISVTALTPAELGALPDDDRWWREVVRDARVLKGAAPEVAKRASAKRAGAA